LKKNKAVTLSANNNLENELTNSQIKSFLVAAISGFFIAGCASSPPAPTAPVVAAPTAAAPAAAPPPAWQQGRTGAMASSPLAPIAGKMVSTAASDIPLSKLNLPPGFKAEIWATGMPGARAMARAPSGKIFVGTRGIGRVYELTDAGPGARTVRTVVDKLNQPAGVEFNNGSLYVMAIDKVLRFDGIESNPSVAASDITQAFALPREQHHNWKYIRFGPDGKLYVPFGAPCNICEQGPEYAQIRRYNPDGSGMEVLARGVRNTVGFDFHPVTKELWFSNHGRDWMGDDSPDDTFNKLSGVGQNFGFPYCHSGTMADKDIKKDNPCNGVAKPVALMGPHTAVMGVHFYTGNMFPAEYKNMALVARKGSWNRTQKSGYDVVMVKANNDGSDAKVTPFITGFMNAADNSFWGRPAYMLQLPDGSLLLSDEQLGAIYRISYSK
jgi:glucose/arabinose dehydrogenase